MVLDGVAGKNVSAAGEVRRASRHGCEMSGLEAIVAHGTGGCKPDVHEGSPALQLVVAVAVKEIGSANRDSRRSSFDGSKSCVIVHHVVSKKNLLPASAAHVQCRKIIQSASSADAREEPAILLVPEAMRVRGIFWLRPAANGRLLCRTQRRGLLARSFLRANVSRCASHNKQQQAEESDSLPVRHFEAAGRFPSRTAYYRSCGPAPPRQFFACSVAAFATPISQALLFVFCGGIFKFSPASILKEYPCRAPC